MDNVYLYQWPDESLSISTLPPGEYAPDAFCIGLVIPVPPEVIVGSGTPKEIPVKLSWYDE